MALDILVHDVDNLPWEAIVEYREHPGSEEAPDKLREFEDRVAAADPDDPLEFQRDVFREISRALIRGDRGPRGEPDESLAAGAAKTAVSFIPLFGPFIGPGLSVAQASLTSYGSAVRGTPP